MDDDENKQVKRAYLRDGEGLLHVLEDVLEIVLQVLHHHEDVVCAWAHDDLAHIDHVHMLAQHQDTHFSNRREWEAVVLNVHFDLATKEDEQ